MSLSPQAQVSSSIQHPPISHKQINKSGENEGEDPLAPRPFVRNKVLTNELLLASPPQEDTQIRYLPNLLKNLEDNDLHTVNEHRNTPLSCKNTYGTEYDHMTPLQTSEMKNNEGENMSHM